MAARLEMEVNTPEEEKLECVRCGKKYPRDPLFFSYNRARKSQFSRYCKECERAVRIEKGVVAEHDKRQKMY
jgi:NAD-dependent SIR2 family protein deacetylase